MSRYNSDCKVYVGDLGNNATKHELEDAFSHYGPLKNVWVARNPPGFAFVEFEDARDAEDAVRGLDGRTVCGRRARVEISNGRRSRSRGPPRGRGGSGYADDKCYDCGERGHYARNCDRSKGGGGGGHKRRRSHSRSRSKSRSRSRSKPRGKRSYSRSISRSRSRSRNGRGKSLSKSRSRSRSRSPRRSRSRSPR